METNKEAIERFKGLFEAWEKAISDPKVQISSRPQDYIDNEPYREMVKMGEEVIPLIIEKLEHGVFFLNQAVADITGVSMEEMIGKDKRFISEQEKSTVILRWWKHKSAG